MDSLVFLFIIVFVSASPNPVSISNHEFEFQDILISASNNWSFVQAFRECSIVTLPLLQNALVPHLDQSVRNTMGKDFPPISDKANQTVLQRMAEKKETLAASLLDAATIVIIQATLDSAINEYLLLLARVNPSIWESDIRDDKVKLCELKGKSYADFLKERAEMYATSLARTPLPKKVQLILDRCYRGDIILTPSDFRFDIPRLKVFDDMRHDVAHGRGMGVIISNIDDLLSFLWQTLLSIEEIIAVSQGLNNVNPDRHFDKAGEVSFRKMTI